MAKLAVQRAETEEARVGDDGGVDSHGERFRVSAVIVSSYRCVTPELLALCKCSDEQDLMTVVFGSEVAEFVAMPFEGANRSRSHGEACGTASGNRGAAAEASDTRCGRIDQSKSKQGGRRIRAQRTFQAKHLDWWRRHHLQSPSRKCRPISPCKTTNLLKPQQDLQSKK